MVTIMQNKFIPIDPLPKEVIQELFDILNSGKNVMIAGDECAPNENIIAEIVLDANVRNARIKKYLDKTIRMIKTNAECGDSRTTIALPIDVYEDVCKILLEQESRMWRCGLHVGLETACVTYQIKDDAWS